MQKGTSFALLSNITGAKLMNITLVLDSRKMGGIESHVFNLASSLKTMGLAVNVLFIREYPNHPLHEKLANNNIEFKYLEGGIFSLVKYVKRNHISLLHSHGYKSGIYCRIVGLLLRIPIVSTYHAGEPGQGKIRLYNKLDKLLSKLCYPIAVSKKIAKELPTDSEIISNFVTVEDRVDRSYMNRIAFVGRLSEEKGPDTYCEISGKIPQAKFQMYGDGMMRENLQRQYSESVTFYGALNDMRNEWRNIDLLCITSKYEGMPLVALEAMSHSVPIIAFDVGDINKLISKNDGGWLIPAGDKDKMIQKIMQFCGMTELNKIEMGAKARTKIMNQYSSDVVVQKICDIYYKLVRVH